MKTVRISDITLREFSGGESALSFREKLEIARTLDRLHVDVIELPPVRDRRADMLLNRTVAGQTEYSAVAAAAGLSADSVRDAWESVRDARMPVLHLMVPVSPVQMEYVCARKAPAVLDMIGELTELCRSLCERVEFSALDATRAEEDFLCAAVKRAIASGAGKVTLCDSAGALTPTELGAFIDRVYGRVPELGDVILSIQTSDELRLSIACAFTALEHGASEVKTAVDKMGFPRMEEFVRLLGAKGAAAGLSCGVRTSDLHRSSRQLQWILRTRKSEGSPFDNGAGAAETAPAEKDGVCLSQSDGLPEVVRAVEQLGYSLTDEDNDRVLEAVRRVTVKKNTVGSRDLEAIIASTALQAPTTYHIDSYVVTSGNKAGAMASVTLEREGKLLQGVASGDGPVDASFLAVEKVIGHHYELDEFQIQAVTEGREAMGSAFIKLRAGDRLYSGSGISTDIIGACIRAYVNALNKIVYEEG